MSFIPRPQEIYRHFKGNLYQVTAVAEHTETREQLVIYQALYGDFKIYARPLAMFVSRVDREKYPDVEQEFRFELQGLGAERQKVESEPEAAADMAAQSMGCSGEPVRGTAREAAPEAVRDTPQERMAEDRARGTQGQPDDGETEMDPFVLEFLDADSYEQRLNILAGLHHRITDEMITTMAIACDIEVDDGDIEERYEALRTCLLTLERYECNRLR